MSKISRQMLVLCALVLLPLAAACGGPSDDPDAIRQELSDKGTLDLMEEIDAAEYEPPSDGELSEQQIAMFLEVKEREAKIQKVALESVEAKQQAAEEKGGELGFFDTLKAMGDMADVGTAGMRAAVELGHNPKEFLWVQEKVLEAYAAERNQELQGEMSAMATQVIEQMKAQRDAMPAEQRAMLDEQIADMEQSMVEGAQPDDQEREPGMAHNVELVREHRAEIERALNVYERSLMGVPQEGADS